METPELDRLSAIAPDSQKIGEFLDVMREEHGLMLCRIDPETDQFVPTYDPTEKVLATYFHIDLDQVEREKQALLAHYGRLQ